MNDYLDQCNPTTMHPQYANLSTLDGILTKFSCQGESLGCPQTGSFRDLYSVRCVYYATVLKPTEPMAIVYKKVC